MDSIAKSPVVLAQIVQDSSFTTGYFGTNVVDIRRKVTDIASENGFPDFQC